MMSVEMTVSFSILSGVSAAVPACEILEKSHNPKATFRGFEISW